MPRLDDPIEFALIRKIYFKGREQLEDEDQLERLERMTSRRRNTINKR